MSIIHYTENMKRNLLVLIIVAFFIMDLLHAQDTDFGTIVFANVLYRHGDRTPIRTYPNDPYNNESIWPVPYGQLTNIGKNQHLLLGRWIRKRYSHLLNDLYSPYDIYIQSTDVDRTLMSAESQLAGLYPPVSKQIWSNIKWMPIPVHTIPEDKDNILAAKKYCPRYDYELEKVLNSPEIQKINKENEKLYAYLTEKTGNKISSLRSVEQLYDILFIEDLYNKTLPEWTKSIYPDKLKLIAIKSFTTSAYNKILQRLKSGSLLGEMIDHMEKKSKNALVPDRKISYKNISLEAQFLKLPGCTTMCPLNQFIRLTKDVIPINWEKECAIEWEQLKHNMSTTAIIAIMTSSILILVLLILSIIGFIYWHYKREHNQYYFRLTTDPI
ncbi:lysosomal acid phosphatase-like isoform X3 [Frieseomelitta varia]|uniref:lysosomal acid phosphatase-like isoform X3 n=1 Tax=Frieseomelitta varia TaxID=561572 RepID=UPI001CB67B9B|nr:lysosomal acid phosphatase-like isoform X3 [Frieseomelitta varia]